MILVANYINKDQDKIGQMAAEFMRDLASHGVPVVETGNNGLNITTPHCYITFVTDSDKLLGRRFDVIFVPVPLPIKVGCLKEYGRAMHESNLLDYILMCEDI